MTDVFTQLKVLWDATTKGKWRVDNSDNVVAPSRLSFADSVYIVCGPEAVSTDQDLAFIALSHNAVPGMLAEVERLQAITDKAYERMDAAINERVHHFDKFSEMEARLERAERAIEVMRSYLDSLRDNREKEQVWFFAETALDEANLILGGGDEK